MNSSLKYLTHGAHLSRRAAPVFVVLCLATAFACTTALAGLFPERLDIRDLYIANGADGSAGAVVVGYDSFEAASWSTSRIGDVNGDGNDDLLTGALQAYRDCVVFGQAGGIGPRLDLADLLVANGGDGSRGFCVFGDPTTGPPRWNHSVARAGDFNNDGIDDFLVGDDNRNRAFVLFGRNTGFAAELSVADLLAANGGDGSLGVVFEGQDFFSSTGFPVAGGGDLNGDGIDDIVIGAKRFGPTGPFENAVVVFGRSGGFPAQFGLEQLLPDNGGDGSLGAVIASNDAERDAEALSLVDDFNGDGIGDLAIGAADTRFGAADLPGNAYILFGRPTPWPAYFELDTLSAAGGGDGSQGILINGIAPEDQVGWSIADAGDINGDGISDLAIGAPLAQTQPAVAAGRAYVLFGSDQAFPAQVDLVDLMPAQGGDGSQGFVVSGEANQDQFGYAVDTAGDLNNDGNTDVVISASDAAGGASNAGVAYVLFGSDTGFSPLYDVASLIAAGSAFAIEGGDFVGLTGWDVSGGSDLDGDGGSDLIVSSPYADPDDIQRAGEVYVIYGRRDLDGDAVADRFDNCSAVGNPDQRDTDTDGFGNLCDGDLNNDCIVNATDLGLFKAVFFTSNADADFDGNGTVNATDLGRMKAGFFLPPGPGGALAGCGIGDTND